MPTSNFQPIRLLDRDCCYKFTYLMANSADLDQLASSLDLHCLQRQGLSGSSRTRVKQIKGLQKKFLAAFLFFFGCLFLFCDCLVRY